MRDFLILILVCTSSFLLAQDAVLITINDQDIGVDEFTRIYEKNLSLIADEENNTPEAYLDLFIDYKLKVLEAQRLDLDKKDTYIKELASYRKQLAKNHLTDVQVTETLVQQAYDRMVTERKARHILVLVKEGAAPQDTMQAYTKITEARRRITQGEDFNKVAQELSEDPSAKKNGGDLGWFKAFKMVYPFENAAYTTAVSEVSAPFRTRFGYHIVEPTDSRISKGSRKVAHIMVAHKQADSSIVPEQRIKKVQQLLQEGITFSTLAKEYSDDKNSAVKGGALSSFEEGQMRSKVFEKEAFGLGQVGDISEPFKTEFGWHIITLLEKKPVETYEVLKTSLTQRVKKDARAQVISDSLSRTLRSQYQINDLTEVLDYFKTKKEGTKIVDKEAFAINDQVYTYKRIGDYLERSSKGRPLDGLQVIKHINIYVDQEIRTYHLEHLEEVDADFKAQLREYKEGLLLFDLLETKIWNVAKNDSVGLDRFYQKNKRKYTSPKSVKALVLITDTKKIAKDFATKMKKKKTSSIEILEALEARYDTPIIHTSKIVTVAELPKIIKPSLGVQKIIENEGQYQVYVIEEIIEEKQKELNDARGIVMSDYQKQLEEDFVASLRAQSNIKIHREVLNELSKRYND